MNRSLLEVVCSSAVLFAALALLRHEMVSSVEVDYATAWQIGVGRGWLQDLCVSLLPAVLAACVAGFSRLGYWPAWAIGALAVWGLALANLLFFQYFGTPLEAWTIAQHVGDVWTIRHVVTDMLGGTTLVPALLILGACVVAARRGRAPSAGLRREALRAAAVAAGVSTLAAMAAMRSAPDEVLAGSVVGENVLFEIAVDAVTREADEVAKHANLQRGGLRDVVRLEPRYAAGASPTLRLATFRDWVPRSGGDAPPIFPNKPLHLARPLEPDPARTSALRRRLGLDPEHAPNVIVLFLESVRAYEVQHPVIGPALFPELRGVLERYGISFTTAYTSSMAAGLTARGQFSTSCSMFPNFGGAATFIAHPEVQVSCMADVARDAGYETVWISGGPMHFHNKFTFERLHGTEDFYDEDHFANETLAKPYEGCGFPDKALLERTIPLLENTSQPFYASVLTISTHVPHTLVPEAPVPAELERFFAEHGSGLDSGDGEKYAAYLSRLRYLDQSVGVFFDNFFASDLAENTVVAVLGDHGIAIHGALPANAVQRIEQRARVPLALVSAGVARSETLDHPVHQVDLAPTLAEIAGWRGEVSWIGRPLLESGSPWLYASDSELHYRVRDRVCYSEPGFSTRCYELEPGEEPLFDDLGASVPAKPAQERFFLGLALEVRQAITRNKLIARAP